MAVEAHLAQLQRKHKALEGEIEKELLHPRINDTRVAELKRRKLKIKDEITSLSRPPGSKPH
jgi:hypothetical protein